MLFKISRLALAVLSVICLSTAVQAQDLSDDILLPSIFNIGNGTSSFSLTNSVFESDLSTGVTGNSTGDIDFFNVVVAEGYQLDAVNLTSFDGGGQAFIGFAENQLGGNSALAAEQPAFVASALGFTLVDGTETSLFSDLAAGIGTNAPGIGFDPNVPLEAGTYAFVFQNTGPNLNNYGLEFVGSAVAVPEPSSVGLLAFCGLALLRKRRK